MAVVCKACVLPCQVSCYSFVEDAVAGGTAQPQQLLVPPAWCHHVLVLPELRWREGVLEFWDLQSITQWCAIHPICLFTSASIEIPSQNNRTWCAFSLGNFLSNTVIQSFVCIWWILWRYVCDAKKQWPRVPQVCKLQPKLSTILSSLPYGNCTDAQLEDIYKNTTAMLPHLSTDLVGSCHCKVLVSKYDRKLLVKKMVCLCQC